MGWDEIKLLLGGHSLRVVVIPHYAHPTIKNWRLKQLKIAVYLETID
jgi:hypothetical protein